MTIKDAYDNDFWLKKEGPSVVGDYRGRLPLIEWLNPQGGEKICEPGSGAGFVARMIARSGARVWGCDKSRKSLEVAIAEEAKEPLGIDYAYADISKHLPYPDAFFDAVLYYGVHMHLDPEEQMSASAQEAYRVVRPGGRLLISITHPDLYPISVGFKHEDSPWIRHRVTGEITPSGSQTYREYYRNNKGDIFEDEVWSHPIHFLRRTFEDAGFEIRRDRPMVVMPEDLAALGLTGPTGYPAFYQLEGRR